MKNKFAVTCAVLLGLSLGASAADDYVWDNVVIGGGGFVSGIITSKTKPNVIYARTDVGGAYRWDEASQSWKCITDFLTSGYNGLYGIEAIALDPQHAERIYMLAGTSYFNDGLTMILRSDDYGNTWDTINVTSQFKASGNGDGRQTGERLAVDPNNSNIFFCGTRSNGLWKSTDRGTTWSNVSGLSASTSGQGINFIIFDKNKVSSGVTQRIYAGELVLGSSTTKNLFVSEDAGETWSEIALPTLSKSLMPYRAVLTPGGKYLYVTTGNNVGPGWAGGGAVSRGAFLKYDTENKTWVDLSPENMMDDPADPENPGRTFWDAVLGGFGGVSMDPADSNHIVVSSHNKWKPQRWENSTKVAWGDKIWVTSDGGTTWYSVLGNYDDNNVKEASDSDPYAVLNKNGYNWIEGESIHWIGSVEFDPFNTKRVFAVSGNGIYMADDFGANKRFQFHFSAKGLEETVPNDLVSIPGGPLITVIADYDGFVHADISKPVSGTRHSPQLGTTTGIDYAKLSPNVVVRVGGRNKPATSSDYVFPLYYSTDTARTWTQFATDPDPGWAYCGKVAVSADGKVVLWNPDQGSKLYRTDNWGATWTTATGITSSKGFPRADPLDSNVFYAYNGYVYISTDKGKSFTAAGTRSFSWMPDMEVTPGRSGHIWVAGYAWDGINGGFLARSTDGGKTWVDIDSASDPQYKQRVQHCEAIGFGKEAPGASYPAIYIYGTIGGVRGIWQSIDEAKSWTKIDDPQHQYGALSNGGFVRGDANTFGVVYRSTAGRGIPARMPVAMVGVKKQHAIRPVSTDFARMINDKLYVNISGKAGNLDISVYNLNGRLLYGRQIGNSMVLPLSSMVKHPGMYVVNIRNKNGGNVFSKKMQVIR